MQALVYDENGDLRKAYKWPFGLTFFNAPDVGIALMGKMIAMKHEKLEEIDIASIDEKYFTLEALARKSTGVIFADQGGL